VELTPVLIMAAGVNLTGVNTPQIEVQGSAQPPASGFACIFIPCMLPCLWVRLRAAHCVAPMGVSAASQWRPAHTVA